MGKVAIISKVFKDLGAPVDLLEDWAREPLKRWENKRDQSNKYADVEREIRRQTGVETVKSELRQKEAEQRANLKIRMATEINRINAETEQWTKDKEFARLKDVTEAVIRYKERLTEIQVGMVESIGSMSIELREKAQNLILEKTTQYKAIQDKAQADAEDEFSRILEKFSGNERIMDIMINASQKKLASVIDNTSNFLAGLNDDIKCMNANIDAITRKGQEFIDTNLSHFDTLSLPGGQQPKMIDADAEEV